MSLDELIRSKPRKAYVMPESRSRSYSPTQFREILISLYGPASDWDLASMAAPDFNVKHLTVYRWLTTEDRQISGTPAALAHRIAHPPTPEKNCMIFEASDTLPNTTDSVPQSLAQPKPFGDSPKTDYEKGYHFIVPDQVITRGFADYDSHESVRIGFRPSMVALWSESGERTVVQFHGTSKFMILAIRYEDFNDLLEKAASGHKAD